MPELNPDTATESPLEPVAKNKTIDYARHMARELALLCLPQMGHYRIERAGLDLLIEQAIRLICSEAEDCLKEAGKDVENSYDILQDLRMLVEEKSLYQEMKRLQKVVDDLENSIFKMHDAIRLTGHALGWPLFRTLADLPEVRQFTIQILQQYVTHSVEIDQAINDISPEWSVDRMNSIDRHIIQLAAGEMFYDPEKTAFPIIMNEAVELAKKYGSDESYRFINGVLKNLLPAAEQKRDNGS